MNIDAIRARAEAWTLEPYDQETRTAVQAMLDDADANPLLEAFHQDLAFGTGGMRGIMGPGTNRMNAAVVAMATQGLADYLTTQCSGDIAVAIALQRAVDAAGRVPGTFFDALKRAFDGAVMEPAARFLAELDATCHVRGFVRSN